MTHIICFGDSITRGENDKDHGGWVDRLKSFYISKFLETKDNEVCVFNMGIGGETTDGLIKRFTYELNTRLLSDGDNIVTFAYGTNDIALVNNANIVSETNFTSNLNYCIDYAFKKNTKVFLINILPIIETSSTPLETPIKTRKMEDIIRYNKTILSISEKKKIEHVDLNSAFEMRQQKLLTFDGIHPNSKGHELIYEKIKKSLKLIVP